MGQLMQGHLRTSFGFQQEQSKHFFLMALMGVS
jgi:hypothetical protein